MKHIRMLALMLLAFTLLACTPSSEPSPSPIPVTTTDLPASATPTVPPLPTLAPTEPPASTPEPTESGPPVVPDLVGIPLAEALQLLESLGFDYYVNYRTGEDAPIGTIGRQTPEPGSPQEEDTIVRIYVSVELVIISSHPGLEVGRNADYYFPVELEAGVTYHFYTQDTYNMTDRVVWGPVLNCCGRMSIAPVGLKNASTLGLTFTPEQSGSYDVVIHNDNPVRFRFTLVIAYYNMGD